MKKKIKILTAATLLSSMIISSSSSFVFAESNNSQEVSSYMHNLSYDNYNVLTRKGEAVENIFNKTGISTNDEFVVVEKIKKSISNDNTDISLTASNEDRIFPGALLKADQSFLENNPTLISLKRAKQTISIDLPGMTNNSIEVNNPTSSSVKGSINSLIDRWHNDYAKNYPSIPAKIQYSQTTAQSKSQIEAKFGINLDKISVPLNIDFKAIQSGEKQSEIVSFKQIYYTVSMDAPNNPGDVFDSSVSKKDLEARGLNSSTPPVYVSNVSYGRSIFINFETTNKSTELSAAVNALIKGVQIAPNSTYSKILKDTKFTAVILGGNSGEAAKVVSGNMEQVKTLINEGSTFNKNNPGVAISYTAAFLKDNSIAKIQNNTDYIETKVTSYKNGYLTLDHKGAYIARYFIDWDEVSYDAGGKEILTHKTWQDNGKGRSSHFATTLEFKGNVRNLNVKVQECTGLAWEWWRTIYDKKNIPLVQQRKISNWGTTLHPKLSEEVKND